MSKVLTSCVLVGLVLGVGIACGSSSKDNPGLNPWNGDGGGDGGGNGGGDFGGTFGDGSSPDGGDQPLVVDKCHVPPDSVGDNAPLCTQPPKPPNSFDPVVKWSWDDPVPTDILQNHIEGSMVIPLVANLTDDNGDGEVNLCDTPDVIVTTGGGGDVGTGTIYMLAGDTGKLEYTFDLPGRIAASVTPAIGDLDGDGVPEIVAAVYNGGLVAFDNHGKVKWTGKDRERNSNDYSMYCRALAIADLDGDGQPEIISGFDVFDNKGNWKFGYDESAWAYNYPTEHYWCPATIAADLDGDGKQEVIFGNAAYHADGTKYWEISGPPGQPQIADLDGDGHPEVIIARKDGILLVSHDGKILSGPTQLYDKDEGVDPRCWGKPAVVHDFDGDGHADISGSSCAHVSVYHVDSSYKLSLLWSPMAVNDYSGIASSTAFDFLGRGIADGVYGDQYNLFVYDGATGALELKQTRTSGTLIEYPIVADVDNDGSADILVVSNRGARKPSQNATEPDPADTYEHTIVVYEDSQKRWIPTRRIWNQHAYSVTNVREDGTIPAHPKPSWLNLNTFRTNAQVQGGENCAPPPPNVR